VPISWKDWSPGLNNGHMTLREVYDTLPGASSVEIAWHVRMFENPTSPISFTGAIDLAPHDCIHILLGRGLLNQDEAFVIGYTMGTNKKISRWQVWAFKKIARYFYPYPYKFRKGDEIAYDLGVGRGLESEVNNIQDIPLFTDQYLDRNISDVRKMIGVNVPELRAYYRKEKRLVPGTKESLRLPVDADVTVTRLVRPAGEDCDWYKNETR